MNSLSWLIYLAELCGSLSKFFGIFGFIFLFGGGFLSIMFAAAPEFANTKYPKLILLIPATGIFMKIGRAHV